MARKQLTDGPAHRMHRFESRGELARALAGRVAGALADAIGRKGSALLAVSGGTTPGTFFGELAATPLDWAKVTVTLVDERLVPPSTDRSNARLVRERLLVGDAARARFVPLYEAAGSPEEAALRAAEALAGLPWPLDAAVLGMGADGHAASFFPRAANLGDLLDPKGAATVLPVRADDAAEPRLTLTLAAIVRAGLLCLHIEGEEKRAVLDRALQKRERLPIGAVLDAASVEVYWAA